MQHEQTIDGIRRVYENGKLVRKEWPDGTVAEFGKGPPWSFDMNFPDGHTQTFTCGQFGGLTSED